MNHRRNHIVTALPVVNVIVGADLIAKVTARQCGQHFVGVHVGAGARAGLEHIHREVLHQILFGQQLVGSRTDGTGGCCRNLLQLLVGNGRGLFQVNQSADVRLWHTVTADREVVDRTLGLSGVEGFSRYLKFAHAVFFNSCCGHSVVSFRRRLSVA